MIKQKLRSTAYKLLQWRADVDGLEFLISYKIRELKAVDGLSTKQLAELLGVSQRFANMLEKGERSWSDDMLEKLKTL
jgi:DNA-binding XRE family transcriptional regulator